MKNRNYLRIYANLGKENYTEAEKELLVKTFIAIGEEIFGEKNLRFDIEGSGYGISKGDPLVMQKTFWKKIEQKGYKNLFGIGAANKEYWRKDVYLSQFSLLLQPHNFFRFDADFFWKADEKFDTEKALKIVQQLEKVMTINYVYGYLADESLNSGEWITEEGKWGSRSYFPKSEVQWAEQIGNIPQGAIKQMYVFNVLNINQIEKLDKTTQNTKTQIGMNLFLINN